MMDAFLDFLSGHWAALSATRVRDILHLIAAGTPGEDDIFFDPESGHPRGRVFSERRLARGI
jgi:hypothetical protein